MSELSYSYSEMVNEFDGSNYGSSKMRLSSGSQLKPVINGGSQNIGSLIMKNAISENQTIQEEEQEENKSNS